MASLYRRGRYWWLKFKNAEGSVKRVSTRLRHKMPSETRQARTRLAEHALDESRQSPQSANDRWHCWVLEYFQLRYSESPKTLLRYTTVWRQVDAYFVQAKILRPAQVTHLVIMDYLRFRSHRAKQTVLTEIKVLRLIMDEAIRRGWATANPCVRLGIKRERTRIKPAITDPEIAIIRENLANRPGWMRISFEIAIHQGCRFSETCLPMAQIDLKRMRITFDAKGGKTFTTALHPRLVPLMNELRGRTMTYDMPAQTGRVWTRFFRKIGLRHLCFHCTRVTVATRLAEAGVSQGQAMRFIGHSSSLVHSVYQRLQVDDLSPCVAALRIPLSESQGVLQAKSKHSK